MSEPKSLFVLEVMGKAGTEFSRPMAKDELEAFIREYRLGGRIHCCYLIPLVETDITIPWEKGKMLLDEVGKSEQARDSADGSNTDASQEVTQSPVRAAPGAGARTPSPNKKRRARVVLPEPPETSA